MAPVLDLNLGPHDVPDPGYRYVRGERRTSFQPRIKGSNIRHDNEARLIMERVVPNQAGATGGHA